MTNRERYLAIWNFQKPDYFPLPKFEVWKETVERWHREGLPEGKDPNEYLGIDFSWITGVPIHLGPHPLFEVKVLSQDDRYVFLRDECGVTKKMIRRDFEATKGCIQLAGETSSMSEWLDYPVHSYKEWEHIRDTRFLPDLYSRLPQNWETWKKDLKKRKEDEVLNVYNFPFFGTLGTLRQYIGLENLSYLLYDSPEEVKAIIGELTEFWISLLTRLHHEVEFDRIMFFEDMCSSKAPIISPSMFDEFFSPCYCSIIKALRSLGVWSFAVDSDGNCSEMLPVWEKDGINEIWPAQVSAGVNIPEIRKNFPNIRIHGGINKVALSKGKEDIHEEVKEKLNIAWKLGGYFPWIEHLVPPDVSWDNIQYYVEYYRKYAKNNQ